MKGDFSRIRFNPGRHYTSVLEQQGRVSLDADANEQRAIDEYIRDTENTDIIGNCGAPQHDAGFAIRLGSNGLEIGTGRYYVHGILCENEASLDYTDQPYLLGAPSQAVLLRDLRAGKYTNVLVYLEVWQRLVTALDDPCLREPALGQADTTDRLQTVWRVVAEGVTPGSATGATVGRLTSVADLPARQVNAAAPAVPGGPQLSPCCLGMYASITDRANFGKMSAQTTSQSGDCTCQPTPAAGYRGLENQLYRVEIHQGGDEKTATFKWSRENGSVVVAVTGVSGSGVTVDSLGPDANLGFQASQWVELSDDTFVFGIPPNQPGDLYQITKTLPEQRSVTMDRMVTAVDTARNARMRRWEQFGATASMNGVPLSAGTWIDLENGIQVQFAPGQYEPGDYWLIPARTASGQIDWPPCGGDGSDFQPPQFTPVYRAPLACVHVGDKRQLTIDDCRLFFLPLTELGAEQAPPALHVSAINWVNDDFLTLDQLLVSGLKVSLDVAFTGHVDPATFTVWLELPAPGAARSTKTGGTLLRTPFVLDGTITANDKNLLWKLPLEGYTWYVVDEVLMAGASVGAWTRARVKLLGREIFNVSGSGRMFLDGQSYGTNAVRQDGKTPRIDLQLPSGNSEKASDFESWFYLAPVQGISAFAIEPAAVRLVQTPGGFNIVDANDKNVPPAAVVPTGTITLNYPALADTKLSLSIASGGGTAGIVSIPNMITIPAGQRSQQFKVGVSNPGASTQNYQINAVIDLAGSLTSSRSAPFSVTGFATGIVAGILDSANLSLLKDAVEKVSAMVTDSTTIDKAVAPATGDVAQPAITAPTGQPPAQPAAPPAADTKAKPTVTKKTRGG